MLLFLNIKFKARHSTQGIPMPPLTRIPLTFLSICIVVFLIQSKCFAISEDYLINESLNNLETQEETPIGTIATPQTESELSILNEALSPQQPRRQAKIESDTKQVIEKKDKKEQTPKEKKSNKNAPVKAPLLSKKDIQELQLEAQLSSLVKNITNPTKENLNVEKTSVSKQKETKANVENKEKTKAEKEKSQGNLKADELFEQGEAPKTRDPQRKVLAPEQPLPQHKEQEKLHTSDGATELKLREENSKEKPLNDSTSPKDITEETTKNSTENIEKNTKESTEKTTEKSTEKVTEKIETPIIEKLTKQSIANITKKLEIIIQKMTHSPMFETAPSPALLVDKIINNTNDIELDTKSIDTYLRDYIFKKTHLKMLPVEISQYDFIAKITIKSLPPKEIEKKKIQSYFVSVEVFDKENKLKGYWSATTE